MGRSSTRTHGERQALRRRTLDLSVSPPPAHIAGQSKTAAQAAAGGGPEEPGGEHNSQRNLVAVENDDELPHENDLPDDRAESDQRQSRPYGRRRLFRTRHCDGLHRSATKTRLESRKAKRSKQYAADRRHHTQPS